jgi:hypothetical protein
MKLTIGKTEFNFGIRTIFVIIGYLVMAAGWYVDHRFTKLKNELRDEQQDAIIMAQKIETDSLKLELTKQTDSLKDELAKQKSYVETNADDIVWIVRILKLDSD